MKHQISLRPAEETDLPKLRQLAIDTIRITCAKDYTPDQINVWIAAISQSERWITCIRDQFFIVAEINDQIAGFGSLQAGNYLDLLYVHRHFTRKGIARKLFDTLLQESIRLKSKRITTYASQTAKPFFKRMGFRILKPHLQALENVDITNYLMERKNILDQKPQNS